MFLLLITLPITLYTQVLRTRPDEKTFLKKTCFIMYWRMRLIYSNFVKIFWSRSCLRNLILCIFVFRSTIRVYVEVGLHQLPILCFFFLLFFIQRLFFLLLVFFLFKGIFRSTEKHVNYFFSYVLFIRKFIK